MSDRLLPGLLEALDLFILQCSEAGDAFQVLVPSPDWVQHLTGRSEKSPSDLLTHSDFLQEFLQEAQHFWKRKEKGQLRSGIWCERDATGQEHQLEATAIAIGQHKLLLIQRLGTDSMEMQSVLQKARESSLEHHQEMVVQKQVEGILEGKLEQSENLRDDLVAVLDRLQLGTLMTDVDGRITFLSQSGQRLLGKTQAEVNSQRWDEVCHFSKEDRVALGDMAQRPAEERARVPIHLDGVKGRRISLEIDLQDDPRNVQRKIFFLYDVTEIQDLRRVLGERAQFHDLVGKSKRMREIYQRIEEIARVDATVLIEGETGTGKELVARAIHEASARKGQSFIAVNCAGLTDSLLGSQLFGHKRGAFTGATTDHQGFFEAANGGTLFLDEIGDMPQTIQTTLLRVLQEKEITRLGESQPRKIDVRVIAATHQNLQDLVASGKFRADLLYRIRVARIHLPALRDRREDIPLLSAEFLGQARATTGKSEVQDISAETMQRLMRYPWPGNVRELKSAFDYALIHCRGPVIQLSDLPPEILESNDSGFSSISDSQPDEREQILTALKRAKGKRAEAARILHMSRSTLYRRLNTLGIPTEE